MSPSSERNLPAAARALCHFASRASPPSSFSTASDDARDRHPAVSGQALQLTNLPFGELDLHPDHVMAWYSPMPSVRPSGHEGNRPPSLGSVARGSDKQRGWCHQAAMLGAPPGADVLGEGGEDPFARRVERDLLDDVE